MNQETPNQDNRTSGKPGKVLIITYTFAPSPWVGVYRNLKYCKFLPRFGWTPVVLTARIPKDSFKDERLLDQVPPAVSIFRAWDFDPAKIEAKLAEGKLRRLRDRPLQSSDSREGVEAPPERTGMKQRLQRLRNIIKEILKESPDSHVFWVPSAFISGCWILATSKVDVIYCSSPPHSSHLVAYLLGHLFRKPYVLDFRDPWYVEGSIRPPKGRLSWITRIEARFKRAIVRSAAHSICVSRGEREELLLENPGVPADRVSTITNGFDPADTPATISSRTPLQPLTFLHAGTIYPGVADELFEALERICGEGPSIAPEFRFHFIGDVAVEYLETIQRLTDHGIVRSFGTVSHSRAMSMMAESDVLMILMGGTKYEPSHIPSKTFEYMQIGKPVLAVSQPGEMSEILRRSGIGTVVPPRQADPLISAIRSFISKWAAGELSVRPDLPYIASFHREHLADTLARTLDSVRSESTRDRRRRG